jgi:hypothetical protein
MDETENVAPAFEVENQGATMILENKFVVGVRGDKVVILGLGFGGRSNVTRFLTKEEAMNLAAWLAALSDPNSLDPKGDFQTLLQKVIHL